MRFRTNSIYFLFITHSFQTIPKKNTQPWRIKKGPSGDRIPDLLTKMMRNEHDLKHGKTSIDNEIQIRIEPPEKEQLITSSVISTLSRVPKTKQVKKYIKKRPPFK